MNRSVRYTLSDQRKCPVLVVIQNSSSSLSRNGPGAERQQQCPVAVAEPAKTATTTHQLEQLFISYATPTLLQYTQAGVAGSWFLA
jgi:hypothetical protein